MMDTENLLSDLQIELDRAIKVSQQYSVDRVPELASSIAHYADGLRFAITKIKRAVDVQTTSTV
jgi:hypothetical protein